MDTNALMAQAQFGIDIFEELSRLGYDECVVPSAVVDEMEVLRKKVRGDDKTALAIALSLVKRCEVVEAPGEADKVLADMAKETKTPVFTNDARLRAKLRRSGVKTIFLRSKHILAID